MIDLEFKCEGCGGSRGTETILGEIFHRECAPKQWIRDLDDRERFMRRVHQRNLLMMLEPDDPFHRRER